MRYSGLRFFNGTKSEIELSYDSTKETFEGSIHLNEVSTGLYETVTVFMLEEAINPFGAEKLVKPVGSANGSSFRLEFINAKGQSKDINFVSAKLADDGEMYVDHSDAISLEPQDNAVAVSTTNGIHTLGTSYAKDALQFTIALKSEDDKPHYRYLRIYDNFDGHLVATIYVYGETLGEDERLATLLSNFGTSLSAKDQFLFKDHDINEIGVDWKLINRKRKELLLELGNIKPFVGTYKALINAIKFFGYNNLTLKEYWLAIDDRSPMFGKMKAVEVSNTTDGFVSKRKEVVLPSSSYKKTSRFGLFYKLNQPDGTFDEWDTPQVEEVFDFTPDEVLVKLYGLKNKLQREYLPLQAKIIDIIGEGDFYMAYNTNIWNSQNTISDITTGVDANIKVHNPNPFIEDLQKVSSLLEGGVQDFARLSPQDNNTLNSDVETFYQNYYDIDRTTFESGNTNNRIGAPVTLECDTFKDTWDDAEFTFDDTESYITWDNWWHKNIYEVKWTIVGPKGYSQTIIGGLPYTDVDSGPAEVPVVDDYRKVSLALPYSGSYDVKVELFDLFNNVSVYRIEEAINVSVKPVEFYSVYRWKDTQTYLWGRSSYRWTDAGGDWDFPQQNKDDVNAEIASLYMTLDRANYLHDDSNGINFSMVRGLADGSYTTGPYFWRNLKEHVWNDGNHTWWDATVVGTDRSASFEIKKARAGAVLEITHIDPITNQASIGQHIISTIINNPTNLASWQTVADELNNSTDPIISKFYYNPLFIDLNNDGINDECTGIRAVGKNYSKVYDFDIVNFTNPLDGIIINKVNYMSNNPTYNDVRISDNHVTVEKLTHMTFSADNSKMAGKLTYRWKITNNSRNEDDIYYNNKWLTYLFEQKGDYTIELEVTDINGNTNNVIKNALTIK